MSDAAAQVIQLQRLLAAAEARAEAAERKVAAVEAVLDDQHKPFRFKADDLRAALDTAADPDTPTPDRWARG